MKKRLLVGTVACAIALQVGCSNKSTTPETPKAPETKTDKVSYWLHNQVDEIEDITEDIREAYEDNSFTEVEEKHLQKELSRLNTKLMSEKAKKHATQEELNELIAANAALEQIVNDTNATKDTVEKSLSEMKEKVKTLFARVGETFDYAKEDMAMWMDEFADDAYDLVEEGKEFAADTVSKVELEKDIAEFKAEWEVEKAKALLTDKEKEMHTEVMAIVDKMKTDIDKDKAVVKQHITELETKLKEK